MLFLAYRGKEITGRVAAISNPRHNTHHGSSDGFFGLFECTDDPDAAQALFEAAAGWLRARGLTSVIGPVSFSTNGECGTLVEGFSSPPTILTPYNPPYHAELLGSCGFAKAKDLWAWEWTPDAVTDEAVTRLAEHTAHRRCVRVRSLDMRDFAAEVPRLREIYNSAWERNWGFVPATEREFGHLAAQLRRIVRPELALLAEVDGDPAAFCLTVPDANQALLAVGGRLTRLGVPVGLFRAARAAKSTNRCRLIAMGVKRKYRYQGLDALLCTRSIQAVRRLGYASCEISWVLEDNEPVTRAVTRMGGQRSKTYRIYQRPL
ncbi:N-acetyltransferase [Streptomyces griseocarneus]|nr:N-acetyltransferase [Streptomyces griseocarneus]